MIPCRETFQEEATFPGVSLRSTPRLNTDDALRATTSRRVDLQAAVGASGSSPDTNHRGAVALPGDPTATRIIAHARPVGLVGPV